MKILLRAAVIINLVMTLLMNPLLLAWGNPPPGRWEKVVQTEPGDKISVYAQDGSEQSCRFRSLDDQFLTCIDEAKQEIQFELNTVNKIVLSKTKEYSTYGALIGAVAGVGISVKIESSRPGSFGGDLTPSGQAILIFAAPAALGALGGFLAGGFIGSAGETIYISKEAALAKAKAQ